MAERQQDSAEDRQELTTDLEDLLNEENGLRESAQQAQKENLEALKNKARELAAQQQRINQGVREEAREAAADARSIANELQKIKQDADRTNQQIKNTDADAPTPDTKPLQDAINQLRQGNLGEPEQQAKKSADEFEELGNKQGELAQQTAQKAEKPAGEPSNSDTDNPANDAEQQKQQAAAQKQAEKQKANAEQAQKLSDRLDAAAEKLAQLREARQPQSDQDQDPAGESQQPNPPAGS